MPAVSRSGAECVEAPSPEPLSPPPPPRPEAAAGNSVSAWSNSGIQQLLSTEAARFDFFVTEKEAKTALAKLELLPPSEFHAAMQSLNEGGQLVTLLDKLDWADQCRFLSCAAEKKYLEVTPEKPGVGPLQPPGQPKVYHQDMKVPRAINDLIGEYAKNARGQFARDYGEYSQRYEQRLGDCASLREVQVLGRPASAFVDALKTDKDDPRADAYSEQMDSMNMASQSGPYLAVANRMDELTGVRRDGSAWFEVKLEGQLVGLAGDLKVETDAPIAREDQIRGGATSELGVKGRVGLSTIDIAGTGTTGKVRSDGTKEFTQGWKNAENQKFGLTLGLDKDENLSKVDVTALGVKSKFERDAVGFEVMPIKLGTDDVHLELGSYSSTTIASHQVRGGLVGKVKVGAGFDAKLAVGGGLQFLRTETVARALSGSHDVFALPPELERGAGWTSLSPERRAALEQFGWREPDWNTALEQRGAR